MTHYDTLGVPKDANAVAIKRAYRKKRAKAHPDREGGSHQAMVALTRAYDTLSDSDKRARYDQTGEDAQASTPPPLDTQARNLIMGLFDQIVEHADDTQPLIELVRLNINNSKHSARGTVSQLRETIKRLEKRKKRLKYTGKERNFLLDLLELKIGGATQKAAKLEEQLTVMDQALEMLRDFAYEPEEMGASAILWPGIFTVGSGR